MKKLVSSLVFILLLPSVVTADDYYVSPTGNASWGQCTDITMPCSMATANQYADVGDTVYIMGGEYLISSGTVISPSNSGTAGNPITYSNYKGETVQFTATGTASAVSLTNGQSYIRVTGLKFDKFRTHLNIGSVSLGSSYNEISYCEFSNHFSDATITWAASTIRGDSQLTAYNHIHHNSFGPYGYHDGDDRGVVFRVGIESSTSDQTRYNLIEYNTFKNGPHHVVELNGRQNVFRGNTVRNPPFFEYDGGPYGVGARYGGRIMYMVGGWPHIGRNLIENNTISYGGPTSEEMEYGGSGGTYDTPYNIFRQNVVHHALLMGMYISTYGSPSGGSYNKIYNNIFWYNGHKAEQYGVKYSPNWITLYTHGIYVRDDSVLVVGNSFKNNIFYQNKNAFDANEDIIGSATNPPQNQTYAANWYGNVDGDPKFVNISGTPDPDKIGTQFDFRLQSDSGAINNGAFLTTITSPSGSGTTFLVEDAGYFFDGWGMSAIPTATIEGDVIQLEGQHQRARITGVDYDTNMITVDTPLTWTKGQGVSLAYEGSAPDMGAHEYIESVESCQPGDLYKIINSTHITACNCSQQSVQAAIDNADDGDTVFVPSGNCTWPDYIPVNKEIMIQGESNNNTIITRYGFDVADGTDNWRITGFTFAADTTNSYYAITTGSPQSSNGCRNFRIDNCRFTDWDRPIILEGHSTGVIDNNQFLGGGAGANDGIIVWSGEEANWLSDTNFGSSDFLFIEGNIFNNQERTSWHSITAGFAARMVVRHNSFIEGNAVNYAPVDAHGFCSWGDGASGTRAVEIYDNSFIRGSDTWARCIYLRGGTAVVYNNTFDQTVDVYDFPIDIYHVRSYDCGAESSCSGISEWNLWCDTNQGGEGYICKDQPGAGKNQASEPMYFWNNKDQNGNLINATAASCPATQNHVQENRDFFNSPMPDYIPYIYPHPLTQTPFGKEICDEGEIASGCWCEGLRTSGFCCNGYYRTEDCTSEETYHPADTSPQDGCITMQELAAFINLWKQDSANYPMHEMMEAIALWKAGTGCS